MPALPSERIVVVAPFAQLFSERVWRHAAIPGHRTGETSSVPAGTRGEGRADGFPDSGRTGAGAPLRLT